MGKSDGSNMNPISPAPKDYDTHSENMDSHRSVFNFKDSNGTVHKLYYTHQEKDEFQKMTDIEFANLVKNLTQMSIVMMKKDSGITLVGIKGNDLKTDGSFMEQAEKGEIQINGMSIHNIGKELYKCAIDSDDQKTFVAMVSIIHRIIPLAIDSFRSPPTKAADKETLNNFEEEIIRGITVASGLGKSVDNMKQIHPHEDPEDKVKDLIKKLPFLRRHFPNLFKDEATITRNSGRGSSRSPEEDLDDDDFYSVGSRFSSRSNSTSSFCSDIGSDTSDGSFIGINNAPSGFEKLEELLPKLQNLPLLLPNGQPAPRRKEIKADLKNIELAIAEHPTTGNNHENTIRALISLKEELASIPPALEPHLHTSELMNEITPIIDQLREEVNEKHESYDLQRPTPGAFNPLFSREPSLDKDNDPDGYLDINSEEELR